MSFLPARPQLPALLAATLALAAPASARQAVPITVRSAPAADGGAVLSVTGPALARGWLVVGVELSGRPRALPTPGGLTLQLGVVPQAVIPFETDAEGRFSYHASGLPEGLHVQALFPGQNAAAAGQGASGAPGAGYSRATPAVDCPQPVEPGDLVITEIQRDPAAVADGNGEWFELRNTTACAIDLEGWRLTDELGDFHFIGTGQGVIVPAHGTLVLGRNADPALNGGVPVGYEYANVSFDEADDRIVLLDALGVEMERVAWDASWPANEEGRALSLEPGASALDNDLPDVWCLASAPIHPLTFVDFGTPGAPNPACACMGQEDLPDAGLVDSNCDGIDGDRARAVFVAKSGSPAGLGTLTDPIDSVGAALALAAANPAFDHVYVSKGTYAEPVQLVDGVSIWGGYDASAGWTRSSANLTEIAYSGAGVGGAVVALSGVGLSLPIVIGDLDVRAGNAGAPASASVFAAKLHQVADLRLERVRLAAEAGAPGAPGAPGSGTGGGSWSGGAGGSGGSPTSGGDNGKKGLGPGGGGGGSGGGYPGDGSNGKTGAPGSTGTNGNGATSALPTLIAGQWLVPGGTGSTGGLGTSGAGGGGGGGGSGGFLVGTGGDGGKGGFGGHGGAGGQGGKPGGSSAALVASSSQVELVDCVLEAANGGTGGTSGAGNTGQAGYSGSSGKSGSGGYDGGNGGKGGAGGKGGWGGPGAGGSSFGVAVGQLAVVTLSGSTTITQGAPGAGGSGPVTAAAGLSAAIFAVQE